MNEELKGDYECDECGYTTHNPINKICHNCGGELVYIMTWQDEIEVLTKERDQLKAENDRLKSDAEQNELILLALHEALKEKQEHVQELEQEQRWISVDEIKEAGLYAFVNYHNGNNVGYFTPEYLNYYQKNHVKWVCRLPQLPQEEE